MIDTLAAPTMNIDFLAGTKVLDLGRGYAAPLAAGLLADFGAEVIRVEPPDGDSRPRPGYNPRAPALAPARQL